MLESVEKVEVGRAALLEALPAPGESECVFCYAYRMMVGHGCDNTLRWAKRWRDLRAPHATALERQLGDRGGYCDCEIFMNGWTASPAITRTDPETEDEIWPDPMPSCPGVKPRSTQPCGLWRQLPRGGLGW